MNRDYSEYQAGKEDKKFMMHTGTKNITLNYFSNKVWFAKDGKQFYITVDKWNEYEFMFRYIDEVEGGHDDWEFDEGQFEENKEDYNYFCSKYNILGDDELPTDAPLINVLSGRKIKVNIGEGILDFIYADFDTPFIEDYTLQRALVEYGKQHSDENEIEHTPTKIHNRSEEILEDFYNYLGTYIQINSVARQSLYTAICPPLFESNAVDFVKSFKWYYNYLKQLQHDYQELIEFCFDDEFYPDVFRNVLPSERFRVYCSLNEIGSFTDRTEKFNMSVSSMQGNEMPFGMDIEELKKRFASETIITEQHKELAEKFGITADELATTIHIPSFININYEVRSVTEMLELEFTKMLEHNIRFRKCKRCGKYFIMKGNYDTNYCDRIADGETKNCQDIMAMENYKKKMADNAAITIYNKYYKRYFARVKAHTILEDDFKKWKYEAIVKRDQCSDGIITEEEFITWLDSCFPNRKRKH